MAHSNLIHHIVANIHNDATDTEGLKICCWGLMQKLRNFGKCRVGRDMAIILFQCGAT